MKSVLHVGCGAAPLPAELYPPSEWTETRLDIDPTAQPHIVGSITAIPTEAGIFDGLLSSHNIEHLYAHEVPLALAEFFRVLKPGGMVTILTPDMQPVCRAVANGGLARKVYDSPAGPIAPIDILWGHRLSIAAGNAHMAHRTGFTAPILGQLLVAAGFTDVAVTEEDRLFQLTAHGRKPS